MMFQFALNQMQYEGILPQEVTYMCIMRVWATIGADNKGKQVHNKIARQGIANDMVMSSALLDKYAKRGAISEWHTRCSMAALSECYFSEYNRCKVARKD